MRSKFRLRNDSTDIEKEIVRVAVILLKQDKSLTVLNSYCRFLNKTAPSFKFDQISAA